MLIGIDEVGRGCWAGPLVAGAVLLNEPVEGLRDSKALSKRHRQILAEEIKQKADYGLGWVTPAEVDELGLTKAVEFAMRRALAQITSDHEVIIIDGNYNYLHAPYVKGRTLHISRVKTLVKADDLIPEVSAASILAKVARDEYMAQQAVKFPNYGFEAHVGYGTAAHIAALKEFGITELHRLSYKPIQALLA